MEQKGEILDIPTGKIQEVNFLDDPPILDVNHGDFQSQENLEDVITDEEVNETIFKKSNSSLLNSLFEESKSPENINISSSMNMVTSETLNVEDCLNLQHPDQKLKDFDNRMSSHDTNTFQESPDYPTNNSPKKSHSNIEDNSHQPSEKSINNHSQETFKNEVANLPSERKNQSIPSRNTQPTLAEDSKLVKISLPTNPINLMQTNTQFLNKSRNFFNFITEKSTNIMEKTMLPQHIAGRYNSIIKLADPGVKKAIEDSCTSSESSSTDLTSSSETDLAKIPRTTDEPPQFSTVKFKDESGFYDFETEKSVSEPRGNCFSDREPNTETAHNLDLRFEPSGDEKSSFSNDFADKISLDAKSNGVLNPYNIRSSESLDNSPRPASEEDSEADSSYREGSIDSAISKSPNNGLHNHPTYLSLLRDYALMKKENEKFVERIAKLEERNQRLEVEKIGESQKEEIATLEKTVSRLTNELKTAFSNQESMSKVYAAANKERESMVMKYAVSEKQLIDAQRGKEVAERRLKEISKEHELLQSKLRQSQGERTRICNILDNKCTELVDLQKQVDRLKEDINMKEVKLKWSQTKLKTEMDLQKETQQKLEAATAKINEMKEECDLIRRETQDSMRKFQQSEENKAVTLDQQLKEQQARLILERHVTEDKEMSRLQLQKEVETFKQRQQALIEENNTLSLKIQDLEKSRLSYESNLSNLKSIADHRQREIVDLVARVSQLETLKVQLKHQEQCLASTEAEVERLRQTNQELQMDMDSCRQRESHMLDFTQKLTDKNVRLQSEFTAIEAKNQRLEHEQGPLHERIAELVAKVKSLEENLVLEKKKRIEDCEILAKHVAEQTQLIQNLTQKLEDSEGENAVLKRKHQLSLKEMTRELQHCRKRLEAFETASPGGSLDPTSRTGSSTSLNTGETINGALSDHSNCVEHSINSVDRQSLIDKIIKMQKINVKKAEKIDFMEEHVKSLVEELQKKTKIIQNYILVENFDAMSNNERDKNKAELARYGGIMASVYNHKVSDDHMTLELSLEINQKLQSVLEDTLLKNITLKDNIDTLGEEIAKLTMQIQQRQNAK
ncbi:coiled-coil domain-containing protein 186 isoform X2 [Belonocnema kinseyi]|uniref:coiled-coil domain-containing protein 186 isoform X2 n=1 Tax=Belonocnema kinseyi TaxID=2817044 RepID=UPI00143CE82D|nr:coiled-coil domain-containing protein 186 isoform X2 [Belonocnema kinseyi]